jgi:FtsZ-binding cell division protein ZapB
MSPTKVLTKALSDAIPQGPHPEPHAKWIQVRLDFVQAAIDHIDWLDRGVDEWREEALSQQQKFYAAQATVKIAVRHLQEVLNKPRTYDDQVRADTNARDWLISIGSEPQ